MEDLGVLERLKYGFLKSIWKERVLVGRLVSTDSSLEYFLLSQHPIEKTQVAVGYLNPSGDVDRLVQRELNSFDQVKGDGVFKATTDS